MCGLVHAKAKPLRGVGHAKAKILRGVGHAKAKRFRGVGHAKAKRMPSQGLAQNVLVKATPREMLTWIQAAGVQVPMPTWEIRLSAVKLVPRLQLEPDQLVQRLHETAASAAAQLLGLQTTGKNWATVQRLHGPGCCASTPPTLQLVVR